MIKVYIESAADASKRQELLRVLSRLNDVTLVPRAADAEAILLTDDDSTLIRRAPAYRDFRSKFIVISDSDIMSYYIPALYTSNFRCLLSRGRALTISYYCCVFEDENGKRNIWIDKLKNVNYEKRFLYSFMGGSTCWLRKRLLKQYRECPLNDVLIKPTDHYKHWSPEIVVGRSEQQRAYVETMLSSKFALCPHGASASSIRLFEAMELGCAPVVLADDWIPVEGVDWSFCLFVREADLQNLDGIIRAHSDEWRERGALARRAYEENFSPEALGATLERQMRQLIADRNETREQLIHLIYPVRRAFVEGKAAARMALRDAAISGFRLLGKKFPYDLNR